MAFPPAEAPGVGLGFALSRGLGLTIDVLGVVSTWEAVGSGELQALRRKSTADPAMISERRGCMGMLFIEPEPFEENLA